MKTKSLYQKPLLPYIFLTFFYLSLQQHIKMQIHKKLKPIPNNLQKSHRQAYYILKAYIKSIFLQNSNINANYY